MTKVLVSLLLTAAAQAPGVSPATDETPDNWALARRHGDVLAFSTLFTATEVRDRLADDEGIERAMDWCRRTAVTHVLLETFRSGYTVERTIISRAKQRFEAAGFRVSGCVTTTGLGRKSVDGWLNCMTDPVARAKLAEVFHDTATLFDEIMIDDFFCIDCKCDECTQARGDRSWSTFRRDQMMEVSREYVLKSARRARPDVKVIIKYPQWYDQFHDRGYDVARQPAIFDQIWVGTETRNPDAEQWGAKSQYEAYFMMRWLGRIGGPKCGGGWFDSHDTSPEVYLEQARQSVLGGAREIVLFSYGSLQDDKAAVDVQALRRELPLLFELAGIVRDRTPRGIAAPKPPNSEPAPAHSLEGFWDGHPDCYIFDFIGLLGLPLIPDTQVRADVPAAFLSFHALSDPALKVRLEAMRQSGTPLLMTDTLVRAMGGLAESDTKGVMTIDVPQNGWSLMDLPPERLSAIRRRMLEPFGVQLDAPARVALYLFDKDVVVIENFNSHSVNVTIAIKGARPEVLISTHPMQIAPGGPQGTRIEMPSHSLIVLGTR